MNRRALVDVVSVLALVLAAFVHLPVLLRSVVVLAFLLGVLSPGWRIAAWLDEEATTPVRIVRAGVFSVGIITVPATLLGHFGALSSRALLLVSAVALVLTRLLPARRPPQRVQWPSGVERVALWIAAGAVLATVLQSAYDLRLAAPGTKSYDDPSYHLSAVATWRTYGDLRMIKFPVGDRSTAFYPIAGELFSFALIAPLDPSDVLARYTELPFALLSLVAVFAVALEVGLSASAGVAAVLLFASNPRVFPEIAFSAGTDHVTGFFFLATVAGALALRSRRTTGTAVAFGVALGLLVGTKYTGFLYALPLLLLAMCCVLPLNARLFLRWVAWVAAAVMVTGSYTYLRNLVTTGNPVFPARVTLFGRVLFDGWVHRENWPRHPQYPIDVPAFLLHRTDLWGVLFPLVVLPGAIIGLSLALARRPVRPWYVVFAALPLLVFLEFRFLMIDHQDARYLFGALGVACLLTAGIVEAIPVGARTLARCLLLAAVVTALMGQVDGHARIAVLVGAALGGAIAAPLCLPTLVRRMFLLASAAGLMVSFGILGARWWREYDADRLAGEPVARELDRLTRSEPSSIAFIGSNQPYFYWGSRLQNRVAYLPTHSDLTSSWYTWRSNLQFPHEQTSRRAWLENLRLTRTQYVVVERSGAELPELAWIDMDRGQFALVARNAGTELYAVRNGKGATTEFSLDAGNPHLPSYLSRDWCVQRDGSSAALVATSGASLHLPPVEERPTGVRLTIARAAPDTVVYVRGDNEVIGWFHTAEGPEVTLPFLRLPRRLSFDFAVSPTPSLSHILRIRSGGGPGGTVSLAVDGKEEVWSDRGYTLGVLRADGSGVERRATFDTSDDASAPWASAALVRYVEELPAGAIVVGGVADDASNITEEGVAALRRLGCTLSVRGEFRSAHAFVGTVGAAPGSIPEWRDWQRSAVISTPGPLRILRLAYTQAEIPRSVDTLRCAIDDPAEASSVGSDELWVRGWAQEAGGVSVRPTAFLVDGVLIPAGSVTRSARPDVALAFPDMGDASQAGYAAMLHLPRLPAGRHTLIVRFDASDGRYRLYPPRSFLIGSGR